MAPVRTQDKITETGTIASRFAQVAAVHGNRAAISTPGRDWSYAVLDQCSNAIAARILECVGDDSEAVTLFMTHDALLIAAILGVLKAGRMYSCLEPAESPASLKALIADAGSRLLLTDKSNSTLAHSLAGDSARVIEIEEDPRIEGSPPAFPEMSPESGAWLMHTSGSTGAPKGVWQNHRGVLHHSDVYRDLIHLTSNDRLSLLTSCSLAASTTPLFAALLNGATLCPFALRTHGVERLAQWLREQRVTVYHSVPTVFQHLMRWIRGEKDCEHLRLVRLGGEPVFHAHVEAFRRRCPDDCRLMHAFSSTETGLVAALMISKTTPLPAARIPVGTPVRGVEISLLDERGDAVAAGTEGRIAIRSAHLAQGYWKKPDATAQVFRSDAMNSRLRVFLSGDLGRWLPDGSLEHLGRMDKRVKIRGLQVDLAEVEAAVRSLDGIDEAAVVAFEEASGERRLVSCIVPRAGFKVSARALREQLIGSLPEHAIPGEFLSVAQLPQTRGGKIDRLAIESLSRSRARAIPEPEIPRHGMERNLARIWQTVLGIPELGRHDDFFELGGNSLLSAQVLARIEERFGVSLNPSVLIEHNTVEKLALQVGNQAVRPSSGPLVVLRESPTGRPLFLVHSAQGDVAGFGQLARRLGDRPVYGLQAFGLDGTRAPLTSVGAMARHYLREILAVDPTGPYLLAGTCMGAAVASEIAQRLLNRGKSVAFLASFDYSPRPPRRHVHAFADAIRHRYDVLRWSLIRFRRRKERAQWVQGYRRFIAKINREMARRYRIRFFPGTITIFLTAETDFPKGDRRLLLAQRARDSRVIEIPGPRSGLFISPAVEELAGHLQRILREVEDRPAIRLH